MNLETIMTKNIITIKASATLQEAALKMQEFDIGFLPVVEEQIIGVITDRDIALALATNTKKENKVKSFMSEVVFSMESTRSLREALEYMAQNKIKRLLITKDNNYIGIISLSNLIHSNIEPEKLITCIKEIFVMSQNHDSFDTRVDEFNL